MEWPESTEYNLLANYLKDTLQTKRECHVHNEDWQNAHIQRLWKILLLPLSLGNFAYDDQVVTHVQSL